MKADWKVTKKSAQIRFESGQRQSEEGAMEGLSKMSYEPFSHPDEGNFEVSRGMADEHLNLSKEDLDGATRIAVKIQAAAKGGH